MLRDHVFFFLLLFQNIEPYYAIVHCLMWLCLNVMIQNLHKSKTSYFLTDLCSSPLSPPCTSSSTPPPLPPSQAGLSSSLRDYEDAMSRHHHRFERDYRGPWDRRDVRPSVLHNGGANHSCASAVVNGNNRPGLLPLPVIPSLLPTPPVTVAATTSSSDIAAKRGITATASAKVRVHKMSSCAGARIVFTLH